MISEVRVDTEMSVKFTIIESGEIDDRVTDEDLKENVINSVCELLESEGLKNIRVYVDSFEITTTDITERSNKE